MDVRTVSMFFALLTVVANLTVLTVLVLWLADRIDAFREWIGPAAVPLAWAVAATSTAGSLYYSEVVGFVPCTLCWYQRIAMYPMVLLLGIAALRRDRWIGRYLIPLSVAGAIISTYHYQLQRFPAQASFSCTEAAPCALTYVWQFHYISIPFMALSGFALIVTLLALAKPAEHQPGETQEEHAAELEEALR